MFLLTSVIVHTKSGRAAYFLLSAIVMLEKYQRWFECRSGANGKRGQGAAGVGAWTLLKCPNLFGGRRDSEHRPLKDLGECQKSDIGNCLFILPLPSFKSAQFIKIFKLCSESLALHFMPHHFGCGFLRFDAPDASPLPDESRPYEWTFWKARRTVE